MTHTRHREVEIWAYAVCAYLVVWLAAFTVVVLMRPAMIFYAFLGLALAVWVIFTGLTLLVVHRRARTRMREEA